MNLKCMFQNTYLMMQLKLDIFQQNVSDILKLVHGLYLMIPLILNIWNVFQKQVHNVYIDMIHIRKNVAPTGNNFSLT